MRLLLVLLFAGTLTSAAITLTPADDLGAEVTGASTGNSTFVLVPGNYFVGVLGIPVSSTVSISCQTYHGCVLDALGHDRFFTVEAGGSLTLRMLVLQNGKRVAGGQTPSETWGGAVTVNANANFEAYETKFIDNLALRGGAVGSVAGSNTTFDSCSFFGNAVFGAFDPDSGVTVPGRGGALFCENSPLVLNCTFSSNFANSGGVDGSFGGVGGAVVLFSEQSETPQFRNCLFQNNTSFASSNLGASGTLISFA